LEAKKLRPQLQLIAVSILIIVLLISQAQAGCGRWVVRGPETDFLEDPTFDEAIASSTGPTATVGEGVNTDDADDAKDKDKSEEKASVDADAEASETSKKPSVEVLDVSGNWLVRLENLDGSTLNLILIQSKDRLQGYGSLEDKSAEIPATTTGSISKDAVSLDIKLVKDGTLNNDDRQYRLSMALEKKALEEGMLSGSYEYYLSDELTGEGNATAVRS
jgi:hypothetical protein